MTAYIIRRLLLMIPTLIGVITITFIISEYVPGGPMDQVRAMLEGKGSAYQSGGEVSALQTNLKAKQWDPKLEAQLKEAYGLNHSPLERYLRMFIWYSPEATGDKWQGFFLLKFGNSLVYNRTVLELIKERLPISMSLGIFSFFLTYFVCIILGIAKAVRNGERFDTISSALILVGYSIPGFLLAVVLIVYFGPGDSHLINIIPLDGGLTSKGVSGYSLWPWWQKLFDYFQHMLAPIICLSIGSFAVLTILTKNSILDQMHKLYVTAARARGLSERRILYKHVLRNAMIPLITGFPSGFLAMFFTGSLLIEKAFGLNGLGLLSYTSVIERDFPVVLGSLFIFTTLGLIGQLLTDLAYVIVDPRINFE